MDFVATDAKSLKFSDASFNLVLAMSSLEHILDGGWRTAIKEISRVLTPGGYAVITMSNKLNFIYYLWSKIQQRKGCAFGFEECIYLWDLWAVLRKENLVPVKFASNFWLTPSIWLKWLEFPFLKYFGPRMGFLVRKIKR